MMNFAWPWAFGLLLLPFVLYYVLPARPQQRGVALRIPFYQVWASVAGITQSHDRSSRLNFILASLVWFALVVAVARPQWIGDVVEIPLTGRDLMLAVDVSGSMEIPDFEINGEQVNRLVAVKSIAGDFIARRTGDRLGLILFGSRAYLQTPLTFDRTTVQTMLKEAEIGIAGKETAIGDAIGLALKRLQQRPQESRILILLTDGANTAGEVDPLQAAQLAADAGLKIHTIGIGAERMQVQSFFGTQTVNPSADLDEKALRAIAQKTKGNYFRATDAESLNNIYKKIDELEPVKSDVKIFRPVDELYFWPLAFSLLFVLALSLRVSWLSVPSLFSSKQVKKHD